jgi:hypothetical protein
VVIVRDCFDEQTFTWDLVGFSMASFNMREKKWSALSKVLAKYNFAGLSMASFNKSAESPQY